MVRHLFLTCLIIWTCSDSLLACSCAGTWTTKTAYDNSQNVIYGKVIDTTLVSLSQTMDQEKLVKFLGETCGSVTDFEMLYLPIIIQTKILVLKNYKGLAIQDTIIIYTPRQSSTCGYQWFTEGSSHLIFDSNPNFIYQFVGVGNDFQIKNTLWTNNCTATTAATEGLLKELDSISNQDE